MFSAEELTRRDAELRLAAAASHDRVAVGKQGGVMGERDCADEVRLATHQPYRHRSMTDRGFADGIEVAETEGEPALATMELRSHYRPGRACVVSVLPSLVMPDVWT